ncbi:MAG: ribonuclease III [Candidatus Binatia bacterium]
MSTRDLSELERVLGHRFEDASLLERALVHGSARGELGLDDNETYEFLGDAVLDLAIAHILMHRHPEFDEGELSKRRASLVREETLATIAAEFELGRWLLLGKGEEASAGRAKPRILSGAYEAIIGALYLDTCYDTSLAIIAQHFEAYLDRGHDGDDHKTALQELTQKLHKTVPGYEVIDESGPPHAREYQVAVLLEGRELGRGRGSSRKRAEQEAARAAARQLSDDAASEK